MGRARIALATVVAAGMLALPAVALAHPGHSAKAGFSIISVCLTVTPKSASVAVNGKTIIGQSTPGVPRSCVGL